jgi:SAM-dependent methyltransferase
MSSVHQPEDGDSADALLAAAYAVDSPQANRELYSRWASTYESGFVAERGYVYPDSVAKVFFEALTGRLAAGESGAVLDVGCGTGLGGQALRRLGVSSAIDGLDLSPAMLVEARAKRVDGHAVYRELIEADLTQPLRLPSGSYLGVLSVGTFTHGHVGPEALPEILRTVRPGGVAALAVNASFFRSAGFADTLGALERDALIADLRLVDVPIYADAAVGSSSTDLDRVAHVVVCTVR